MLDIADGSGTSAEGRVVSWGMPASRRGIAEAVDDAMLRKVRTPAQGVIPEAIEVLCVVVVRDRSEHPVE